MNKHSFGTFEELNEAAEFALREVADFIATKSSLPKNMAFVVLLADFGEKGNTFYISNAQREDVLRLMQEFIEKNKKAAL